MHVAWIIPLTQIYGIVYNDEQIIKGAHKFYFEDQDWGDTTKIWDYVYCKNAMV